MKQNLHVSSGDVSVTVSTIFFRKSIRTKIRYPTLKNSLFLISTRNDNISRGVRKKLEIPEGRGVHFVIQFGKLQRGGGRHTKNPFRGGVWIFSTLSLLLQF